MQITEVRVFPVGEEKLKAYVSIVLDECFIINDLKVIQGRRGLFISMPSRRRKRGGYRDVAHPLNNETRQSIEDRILEEYQVALESGVARYDGVEMLDRAEDVELGGDRATPVAAPSAAVAAAAAASAPRPAELGSIEPHAAEDEQDRSLEEVEELHLRDSFWSVS